MAGVSEFSIDFDVHCRSFPNDQHVQNGITVSVSISMVNLKAVNTLLM